MPAVGYQIEIVHTRLGPNQWRYRILSPNGRVLLLSKEYASKGSAVEAAKKFDFFYREFPVRFNTEAK